jgi:hypothetical protein
MSKPNPNVLCLLVDGPHSAHLVDTFQNVILVNAKCIVLAERT